jgi:hypothetical protein
VWLFVEAGISTDVAVVEKAHAVLVVRVSERREIVRIKWRVS